MNICFDAWSSSYMSPSSLALVGRWAPLQQDPLYIAMHSIRLTIWYNIASYYNSTAAAALPPSSFIQHHPSSVDLKLRYR